MVALTGAAAASASACLARASSTSSTPPVTNSRLSSDSLFCSSSIACLLFSAFASRTAIFLSTTSPGGRPGISGRSLAADPAAACPAPAPAPGPDSDPSPCSSPGPRIPSTGVDLLGPAPRPPSPLDRRPRLPFPESGMPAWNLITWAFVNTCKGPRAPDMSEGPGRVSSICVGRGRSSTSRSALRSI